MNNSNTDWVKLTEMGRIDEAYQIYLSENPIFIFSRMLPLRIFSMMISYALVFFIKKIKPEVESSAHALNLSREFLIFWKRPNIIGRFLLAKIFFFYIRNKKLPVRALTWLAHWLVFQGMYKQSIIIFRYVLNNTPKNSRLQGEILSLVGNYFHSRRKLQLAIDFHRKSDVILSHNKDKFFQMFNLGTSAKTYAEIGSLKPFHENILMRYDNLNPSDPDERYGMRVLIYASYLYLISGNIDLGRQFYLSAKNCFQKSGSSLDKAIYCIYESVILFFFRDLHGARKSIALGQTLLNKYGRYKSYQYVISSIKEYLTTGKESHPIITNLLIQENQAIRSELESWYEQFFNVIFPVLEKFNQNKLEKSILALEQATNSVIKWKILKNEINSEVIEKSKFLVNESMNGKTEFNMELFHQGKMLELNLSTIYKKWRNPEIFKAIRSTLLLLQNISREEELKKLNFIQSQKIKEGEIARRIAHDIKSPLATLQIALSNLKKDHSDYEQIKNSTQRIEDIANGLSLQWNFKRSEKKEKILIAPFVESLILNKRYEYQGHDIEINVYMINDASSCYIFTNELEITRTLSNIINNAKESGTSKINFTVSRHSAKLVIMVEDFGCGIETGNLGKIFEKDISFKKNGTGLGLYYAKTFLEENHGNIQAISSKGKGTTIILEYPLCAPPEWIKTTLFLKEYNKVIILDDFTPNAQMIRKKVQETCQDKEIIIFSVIKDFETFMEDKSSDEIFFIMDYDLLDKNNNGLDLIKKYGLQKRSILATHHYENEEVISLCKEAGVKITPKNVFSSINVINDTVNILIADDEKYFLEAMKKNISSKFNLYTSQNAEDVLNQTEQLEGEKFYFIDRDFKGIKSDVVFEKLKIKGERNIYNISEDNSFVISDAIKLRKKEIINFLS